MKRLRRALTEAVETGDAEEVKALLLLPDCDPMFKDNRGVTALIIAAYKGHDLCTQILIPVSDVNAKDKKGMTALMWAAVFGQDHCVSLLLPKSNPGLKDDNRSLTASEHARDRGYEGVAARIEAYALSISESLVLDEVVAGVAFKPAGKIRM